MFDTPYFSVPREPEIDFACCNVYSFRENSEMKALLFP